LHLDRERAGGTRIEPRDRDARDAEPLRDRRDQLRAAAGRCGRGGVRHRRGGCRCGDERDDEREEAHGYGENVKVVDVVAVFPEASVASARWVSPVACANAAAAIGYDQDGTARVAFESTSVADENVAGSGSQ